MHLAWEGPALVVDGTGARQALEEPVLVPAGALGLPGALVPMAGDWERVGRHLRFTPMLPFAGGTTYVLLRPDGDGWAELARVRRPAAPTVRTTRVAAIHPAVDEVPENLLRLSVTFSAPMEEGSAGRRVRLADPGGAEIPQALLPMPPELWDRQRRRLTLLLEPGRTKRGLVPNTVLGAPLAGRSAFDLVVDDGVLDSAGAGLVVGARRSYRIGPPVRARVDPGLWSVTWPAAGSRDALVVVFDRPLDHALALRCIGVRDGGHRALSGASSVDAGDRRWTFSPARPWPETGLELRIDAALEDLAGNSVRRVFDVDLRLAQDARVDVDEVVLTAVRAG